MTKVERAMSLPACQRKIRQGAKPRLPLDRTRICRPPIIRSSVVFGPFVFGYPGEGKMFFEAPLGYSCYRCHQNRLGFGLANYAHRRPAPRRKAELRARLIGEPQRTPSSQQ